MSENRSSIRFIVSGFAVIAILALSVAAESFWNTNTFAALQEFFRVEPAAPAQGAVTNGKIVFQRGFGTPGAHMFVVDSAGTSEIDFDGGEDPSWRPDGSKIIFSFLRELWMINADGTNQQPIKDAGGASIFGENPSWSPDGQKIVFIRNSQSGFPGSIFKMDITINPDGTVRGTNQVQLTTVTTDAFPAWQPTATGQNGALIAFQRSAEIFTISSTNGGNATNITNNPNADRNPNWSPDGTKIVFTSGRAAPNNGDIWKMNPDGTGLVQLTSDTFEDAYPTFSPDGTKIAWSSGSGRNGTGSDRIFVMNADGSGITGPISTTGFDTSPSWAPGSAPAVDLQVIVTDTPDPVTADSTLTYTLSVTNAGTATAPNVLANTAIPGDTLFITSGTSQGCVRVGTGRTVQCSFGNIVAGDTVSKQITVRPTGGSSPVIFNVTVTNGADSSQITGIQTTTVAPATRPSNDNFLSCTTVPRAGCIPSVTGPIQLNGMSGTLNGTNVGATPEGPIYYDGSHQGTYELNHAGVRGGKSVWYTWTPPSGGSGSIDIDTSGSNFDTILAVYSFDFNTNLFDYEIASNDDALGTPISSVGFTFDSHHVYWIAVDGKQGDTGRIVLNWRAVLLGKPAGPVFQVIDVGIFPSVTCTSTSNAPAVCTKDRDTSRNFLLHVKGRNFTTDSRVEINGYDVQSMAGGSIEYLGRTGSTYSELIAHVPPNPPLGEVGEGSVRVITSTSAASASGSDKPDGTPGTVLLPPDGTYIIAHGSRGLETVEIQSLTVPAGQTREICAGAGSGEICIQWTNTSSTPGTLLPTFFAEYAKCLGREYDTHEKRRECTLTALTNKQFAINPQGSFSFSDSIQVKKRVDISASALQFIQNAGGRVAMVFEAGKGAAGVVGNDGNSLVATGGGNLVATGGGNLVATGGGNLIATGGGNLITNDGGTLITNDGGTLITNDGGTLIGNDGGTFKIAGGSLVATGGGNSPSLIDLLAGKGVGSNLASDERLAPASSAAANSSGVGGLILAKSSGGQEPVFTTETDPVTGEVKGYVTMTLDDTSFPRVSDLKGMAFSVLANPAIAQFAAGNVTVNKADGSAIATLTRTGDTSGGMTVDYKTQNDIANDRSDYSPVVGSVTFAPGETTKNVTIPIIKHGYGATAFGAQRKFNLVMVNIIGGSMQVPNYTTINITNTDPANLTTNPLDNTDAQFFVRQQYLDLLGREPTAGELSSAAAPITQCGSDQVCVKSKRIDLSYSTFIQYNQAAAYVFRLYRASYGNNQPFSNPDASNLTEAKKVPAYAAFLVDRVTIAEGSNFAASQLALANAFVLRPEFVQKYPTDTLPDGTSFVDAVLTTVRNDSGIDLTAQRAMLIGLYDQAGGFAQGRGVVMYRLAEESQSNPISNGAFVNAEYDRAFAATLFFGYLKRDGDVAGINSWKGQLDAAPLRDASTQKGLVDAFLNMVGYRSRFGIAYVTVGGRVLTPDGRGLRNATVSMTDSQGVVRTATTSSFGFFSFTDVSTGGTYTIRILSRSYRFAPRTMQIISDLTLPDFVGLE